MLKLKNIVKNYAVGDMTVEALKGVDIDFRENEFVAVLGPSGCGKTTLLNVIGGLDRYTSGDLVINGISTKKYKDVDWDIYRNNSIGFVFQSYNLIPHQTALANVELALTLAGISKTERRRRAAETLESVGLSDQLSKKPNQMSGGQMQRVAIARALVNNPDILLADEPTGALDSETSTQIMEILKEIAKDRLVIMVTHNPDIADKYSNRIIRLLDGKVTADTNPYSSEEEQGNRQKKKKKKISMSFPTALALSLNNLMTKKTRTVLTAFAGSIGIIGIALIMSLSSGMQSYINNFEQDTLSTYPIQLYSQTMDMSSMMGAMMRAHRHGTDNELDKIYSNNIMTDMIEAMSEQIQSNDLQRFKQYIEHGDGQRMADFTNSIQYGYDIDLHIFKSDTSDSIFQVSPGSILDKYGMGNQGEMGAMGNNAFVMGGNTWTELIDNDMLLQSQYDVIAGVWPSAFNEIVFIVNEYNELIDINLYSLGMLDEDALDDLIRQLIRGEEVSRMEVTTFTYDEILSLTFKLVINTDYYVKQTEDGISRWVDMSDDVTFMKKLIDNALELKVVGIIRPSEEALAAAISGTAGYTAALTEYVINAVNRSEIAGEQMAEPEINVFTGLAFGAEEIAESPAFVEADITMDFVQAYVSALPVDEQMQFMAMAENMTEEEIIAWFSETVDFREMANNEASSNENTDTFESNSFKLGIVDLDDPSVISLYPKDFNSKEEIIDIISEYNRIHEEADRDEYVINYTDIVGIMTSGMSTIINVVSWVLIAFVAISLIVSSIMIAIITYISVLERTKEIGILRSIGASKNDISRVFNAETIIEGLVAGALGIGITLLLNIPINIIIKSLTGMSGISELPVIGALGLIVLSVFLTVIAGFIPSKMAAKKDPVVALRSE